MRMEIIKKQDFVISTLKLMLLKMKWDHEWSSPGITARERVLQSASDVLVGFCGGLRGKKILLDSIIGILKFWEEKRIKPRRDHVIVTYQGNFNRYTGYKWHMLPLSDVNWLGL